jgi:hypothetical protein
MKPDYLNQLLAIAHLGLPLTEARTNPDMSIGMQIALSQLEEALLRVQIHALTEQLAQKP